MTADEFSAQLAGRLRRLEATDAGAAIAAIVAYGLRARYAASSTIGNGT